MKEAGPARRAALQEARDAAAADDVPMADVADADPDALMPDATGRLASSSMRTTHLSSRAHATQFSHMLDRLTMHTACPPQQPLPSDYERTGSGGVGARRNAGGQATAEHRSCDTCLVRLRHG